MGFERCQAIGALVDRPRQAIDFALQFVGGAPWQNRWASIAEAPTRTAESDAMSKALAKRGFKFVGSTICYAFMQATGMVNDHTTDCFRHAEVAATT